MKNKQKFSMQRWIKANKYYLLAFILPVVSMLIVFALKDIFPFGNLTYLRSDCYHQYTPYLEILQNKLRGGGSLLYTWNIGGGMNFIAIMAYYLSSPANILTLIWPGSMADITDFFIVMKMGLAGFSMTYFLTKRFGKEGPLPVAFGMTYALSAYFAAFSWNIMWLDCLWVLPFIILGLERLVREGKYLMYCIALAYGIFSNYYIGIMLCLFSVCYFVYLFFTVEIQSKEDTLASKAIARLQCLGKYALFSLISGGLAMIVILPEYFNLMLTKSAETDFPTQISSHFSNFYSIFRSLILIPVADLEHYPEPNLYCSVVVLILVPLFWLCKKISIKERIGKTVLLLFMLYSFSINILDYIWHGFHFPNSLPARESFLYIFVILTMGYQLMLHIKDISYRKIIGVTVAVVMALSFTYQIIDNSKLMVKLFAENTSTADITIGSENYSIDSVLGFIDQAVNKTTFNDSMFKIIMISSVLLIIYALYMCLYKLQPKLKGFFAYLMILTLFCELTINMHITSIPSTSDRTGYYDNREPIAKLNKTAAQRAKEEGVVFYRSEMKNADTRNNGARFNYNSASTFSSVSSAAMQDFYSNIGLAQSFNGYAYRGCTPLTAAMLSIKFEFSTDHGSLGNDMTKIDTANNGLSLYEFNKTLPLGFVINPGTMSDWGLTQGDVFEMQNKFVQSATGIEDTIFKHLDYQDSGESTNSYTIIADDGQNSKSDKVDVYFYAPCDEDATITADVESDGKTKSASSGASEASNAAAMSKGNPVTSPAQTTASGNALNTSFDAVKDKYVCHVGSVEKGSKINVHRSDNGQLINFYAYAFDEDAWQKAFDALNSQPLKVTEWDDTKITGTVDVTKPGLLYTSIPYEEGWSVYVDGEKIETSKICNDAFIGFSVMPGKHNVEFSYTPKGFIPGILITLGSLIVLIIIVKFNSIMVWIDNRKRGKSLKKLDSKKDDTNEANNQ